MLRIDIPGHGVLELEHLLLDYNGTLAVDGALLPGVDQRIERLGQLMNVHVVTADTHGDIRQRLSGPGLNVHVLPPGAQDEAKRDFLHALGAQGTVAVGNGRNDRLMVEEAALGIAVIGREGGWTGTLSVADVVVNDILDALDILIRPLRCVATLRI